MAEPVAGKRAAVAGALLLSAMAMTSRARASASSSDLVEQARAHESVHEDDVAARRYTEAVSLDPADADAWEGLGALRLRLGEPAEAERVYAAGLARNPGELRLVHGLAVALWAEGRHSDAEAELDRYAAAAHDVTAARTLAEWLERDGRTPAQLAVWRMLLATASRNGDTGSVIEARRMVRALVIVVDGADPASSPPFPDATRRALARMARRGAP